MSQSRTRWFVVVATLLLAASSATARVISYSPYTDRVAFPAVQSRTNRHFALVEVPPALSNNGFIPFSSYPTGQLVIYDSKNQEEPRVVFPKDSTPVSFSTVAVREENGVSTILIQTNANPENLNPNRNYLWFLSTDSGATWKLVSLPSPVVQSIGRFQTDIGGPFVNARYSPVRIGTSEFPFLVGSGNTISALKADGSPKTLVTSNNASMQIVGTNIDGSKILYRTLSLNTLFIVDLNGTVTAVGSSSANALDGWIDSANNVFLTEQSGGSISFLFFQGGTRNVIVSQNTTDLLGIFGIPTVDFNAAWIIQRGPGRPTVLSRFAAPNGLTQQWSDITSPEVEAIHAGASGTTLLVQVHRPRPQIDAPRFLDPALALWHVGEGAPREYDELFMNEQTTKAFVHLDVENAYATGEPFVFDSGAQPVGNPGIIISPALPPSAGGSDVVQEWGVVRASFKQKLVLPGMARTNGAFGSYWLSDVVLYNPLETQQNVLIEYVPTGSATSTTTSTTTVTLVGREIRVINDALLRLFGVIDGGGAFFLTPDSGINVTSRTYTRNDKGTYGFGMNGIDFYAGAASARFPVTFAGAFPGPNFRTNLVLTDVAGRGAKTSLDAVGFLGTMGISGLSFDINPRTQQQFNGISGNLGLTSNDNGALIIHPTRGEAIATVIAIDNRTNDPTYFPPDLPSPIVRTIPAIGHVDGLNNSKFRSDLYMYNPSTTTRTVTLQMKAWDSNDNQTISFTMLPSEARVIPDVLFRLFGRSGIARLRYQSSGDQNGVRVTSRTYSIDENGGTYGFLLPPLNNFQSAISGDSLEILGVVGGAQYRTNVGLVDLTAFPTNTPASARIEIIDDHGKTIDSFTVPVPSAGGVQIGDIFHARNLGDGPTAALIRISPFSGLIGAYATMNDNGTNDPTYLAANLSARQ